MLAACLMRLSIDFCLFAIYALLIPYPHRSFLLDRSLRRGGDGWWGDGGQSWLSSLMVQLVFLIRFLNAVRLHVRTATLHLIEDPGGRKEQKTGHHENTSIWRLDFDHYQLECRLGGLNGHLDKMKHIEYILYSTCIGIAG